MTTGTMKTRTRTIAAYRIATLTSRRPNLKRAPALRAVTVRCRLASGLAISQAIRAQN